MSNPYKECQKCHAYYLCPIYNGSQSKKNMAFCDANFFIDRNCKLAEIPPRYRKANMSTFKLDEANPDVYKRVKELVDDIVEVVDDGTNIIVAGDCGCGKTFLACTLLNQYLVKTSTMKDRFQFDKPTGMFISYADFLDSMRWKRNDEDIDIDSKFEVACNVPLLVLDDIGTSKITDYSIEQTFILLNKRYNNNLSTIITSNSYQSLITFLGERSVSRIREEAVVFKFKNNLDRRLVD